MKKRKIRYIILFTVILFLAMYVLNTLYEAGVFKILNPHFKGTIERIKLGIPGAEDLTIDTQNGLAFISADNRRVVSSKGAIYLLDLKQEKPQLIELTQNFKEEFHPHGISLYKTVHDKTLLFVINHQRKTKEHFVEIFEFKNNLLIHLERFQDAKLMSSPNDLVAVGERSFYVTNDHYYTAGFFKTLEDFLKLPYAYINYFDGKKFTKAAGGISYANGINVSKDHKTLLVASTTGRRIMIYSRNINTGILTKKGHILLGTGADNIELDEKGNLWIGCHPKLLDFLAHAGDEKKKSPSQIIKINYTNEKTFGVDEVFLNAGEGNDFSGSSVAGIYKNKMLIGSVFEPYLLLCKMK